MLDIDIEFRKGILFVRLSGILTFVNYKLLEDRIDKLVLENNVKFVTFNFSELDYIDNYGINIILKYNMALSKIRGMALICGLDNDFVKSRLRKSKIKDYLYEVKDEISAINYINLGGYL